MTYRSGNIKVNKMCPVSYRSGNIKVNEVFYDIQIS